MVAVESTMLALGTLAPPFNLSDTEEARHSPAAYTGTPLLIAFICNHCPYVKHVADELKRIGDSYAGRIQLLAINSNDVASYPEDAPDKMKIERAARGYKFPYLFDEDQSVAHAYTAACTPDFFLFDAAHKLFYRGQMDSTRPKRISSGVYDFAETPAHGADLRAAMDALLVGESGIKDQKPSLGCNIKWRSGNEPNYFSG